MIEYRIFFKTQVQEYENAPFCRVKEIILETNEDINIWEPTAKMKIMELYLKSQNIKLAPEDNLGASQVENVTKTEFSKGYGKRETR